MYVNICKQMLTAASAASKKYNILKVKEFK